MVNPNYFAFTHYSESNFILIILRNYYKRLRKTRNTFCVIIAYMKLFLEKY